MQLKGASAMVITKFSGPDVFELSPVGESMCSLRIAYVRLNYRKEDSES